ncbi:Holliday junction resolvase RuvX [Angustibacter aerolatus]|uniref:Putative pre-16S rRNA nuclease n=1 Tax=Angustibacter aerolatus TaxID=1162965 RepID=A0ABQ6JD75_9ACTN|nr:Holliday junction resolvase RuvX [Angustibacter aerolatus]GMA85144.1 putative pre-16S rRNA nuclease [Angustibacter aerolatus]
MRHGVRLGVDVGSVRVGLAASDPSGLLATPVETLARDTVGEADLRRIADEVRERAAIEVLVGLPRSLNGREGPAAATARAYAERLAGLLDVPVRMVDERLSTVSAHAALRSSGVKGRRQRAVVDQAAAVVLLQQGLDQERSTGRPPGTPAAVQGADRPATQQVGSRRAEHDPAPAAPDTRPASGGSDRDG